MTAMDEHSSEMEEPDDLVLIEAAKTLSPHASALQKKVLALSSGIILSLGSVLCTAEEAEANPLHFRLPDLSAYNSADEDLYKNKLIPLALAGAFALLYFGLSTDTKKKSLVGNGAKVLKVRSSSKKLSK